MIFELDLRKKADKRRPIVLQDTNDSLLYWRKKALPNQSIRSAIIWLRRGWYSPHNSNPKDAFEREYFLEGRKLRATWRRRSRPAKTKSIPKDWQTDSFWVEGQSFRFANFPKGESDLRTAVNRWLVKGHRLQEVCRDYSLANVRTLRRAADILGFTRPGHGGRRQSGMAAIERVKGQ